MPHSLPGDAGGWCVGASEQATVLCIKSPPAWPGASSSLGQGAASGVQEVSWRSDPAPEVTSGLSPQHSPHPDPTQAEAGDHSRSRVSDLKCGFIIGHPSVTLNQNPLSKLSDAWSETGLLSGHTGSFRQSRQPHHYSHDNPYYQPRSSEKSEHSFR